MAVATMTKNTFVASYESRKHAVKKARAAGWDGVSDGMLDYIDAHGGDATIGKEFPTKDAALEWLKAEINADKTLFGCGDIDEIKHVQPRERCRYCTCAGRLTVGSWIVDDDGISEQREVNDDCWDGDE